MLRARQAGRHLEPLSDDATVFRMVRPPKDPGRVILTIDPDDFSLSDADRSGVPVHLSTWEQHLTTPEQAYRFLREGSKRTMAAFLPVRDIRGVAARCDTTILSGCLNVLWIHMQPFSPGSSSLRRIAVFLQAVGYRVLYALRLFDDGRDGHSGITGVDIDLASLSKKQNSRLRKDIRAQLADIASRQPPHQVADVADR